MSSVSPDFAELISKLTWQYEHDLRQAILKAAEENCLRDASKEENLPLQSPKLEPPSAFAMPPSPSERANPLGEESQLPNQIIEKPNGPAGKASSSFTPSQRKSRISFREDAQLPETAVSKFVKSSFFDRASATLLLLNGLFIGVQVESLFHYTQAPAAQVVIDYLFCVAFIVELALRLWGFGCKDFWCSPEDRAWNIFDFVVVTLSTLDTMLSAATGGADTGPLGNISVLRVIRVVRIVRVLRVIQVMRFFQDLRIMLAAIVSTCKTASFALVLILFLMYMFGIALTQLVADCVSAEEQAGTPIPAGDDLLFFYGGVANSIFCLFMTIAGGIDWKDAVVPLMDRKLHLAFSLFVLYVAVMVMCIMNVLLGIFCQCAIDTASNDTEKVIQLQLEDKANFIATLESLFADWDDSGDGKCTLQEFQNHLEDANTRSLLNALDIEARDAIALFELMDADESGEVDLNEFVTGCITVRGGAKAVHMEKVANSNQVVRDTLFELDRKVERLVKLSMKK